MTTLEEMRNSLTHSRALRAETRVLDAPRPRLPPGRGAEGGVGQPGGFTNREGDPRAGGVVGLPGGLANKVGRAFRDGKGSPRRQ